VAYRSDLDPRQYTALHVATVHGNVMAIEELLNARADIHTRDALGQTPLHLCVQIDPPHRDEVCLVLLASSADASRSDHSGNSVLHQAVASRCLSVTEALLEGCGTYLDESHDTVREALLEGKNLLGLTALHMAACLGYEAECQLLVKQKADIHARGLLGETPLLLHVQRGHTGCTSHLAAFDGLCAPAGTTSRGTHDVPAGECRWRPIHVAAHEDSHNVVLRILMQGSGSAVCQVDAKTADESTPLMVAAVQDAASFSSFAGHVSSDDSASILAGFGAAKPAQYKCPSTGQGPGAGAFQEALRAHYVPLPPGATSKKVIRSSSNSVTRQIDDATKSLEDILGILGPSSAGVPRSRSHSTNSAERDLGR